MKIHRLLVDSNSSVEAAANFFYRPTCAVPVHYVPSKIIGVRPGEEEEEGEAKQKLQDEITLEIIWELKRNLDSARDTMSNMAAVTSLPISVPETTEAASGHSMTTVLSEVPMSSPVNYLIAILKLLLAYYYQSKNTSEVLSVRLS